MRPFTNIVRASALAAIGLSALAALAGCADTPADIGPSAQALQTPAHTAPIAAPATPADFMRLGGPAAPPMGFLSFCARQPDQCGLDDSLSVSDRQHELYAKYFWPFAFKAKGPVGAALVPTSGDDGYFPQPIPPSRRFDWSGIFPDAKASASSAPAPQTVSATLTWASKTADAPVASLAETSNTVTPIRVLAPAVAPLPTTPELLRTVSSVNERVNRSIRYVSDQALYGVNDYWTLPLEAGGPAAGDCKDYVLEKRRALVAQGVPSGDLSIAIVRTPRGETHAVLLVTTDRGELVLDSLSSEVRPWRKVRYAWLERQAPGQPFTWVTIIGERSVS